MTVPESVKERTKFKFTIVSALLGILAVGLWVAVGCAIYYVDGTSPYYAGACATAAVVTFSCMSALTIVNIVMKLGQNEKADKDIKDIIDCLNLLSLLSMFAAMAGIATSIVMGIHYCSTSRDSDDCVNIDENRSIARGLLAGCVMSLALSVVTQTLCQKSKHQLGFVLQKNMARVSILMSNQQQLQQTTQMNQSGSGSMHANQSNYQWQQLQTLQQPQPNPYQMPQTNFNTMPPPPSYYSVSDPAYPPPPASFPQQGY